MGRKAARAAAGPAVALILLACSGVGVDPPQPAAAPSPGFFTQEQAARGRDLHVEFCAECHPASEFRGADFEFKWRRQTAWQLYADISANMPEDEPGALEPQTYADIIAYILSLNDYQQGSTELEPSREALAAVVLGPGAAKTSTGP